MEKKMSEKELAIIEAAKSVEKSYGEYRLTTCLFYKMAHIMGFEVNHYINGKWTIKNREDHEVLIQIFHNMEKKGIIRVSKSRQAYMVLEPKKEERKYRVKESWIFNLESMHDKLYCLEYDIEDGKLAFPFEVAGKTINSLDDLEDLRHESDELEWAAKSRKVTGREYGRIRDIVAWRVNARYGACLQAGMAENEAGKCFEDM